MDRSLKSARKPCCAVAVAIVAASWMLMQQFPAQQTAAQPSNKAGTPYARPPKEAWKVELLKQPLRAYCIDFNWELKKNGNVFAKPGHWADADPAAHVKWYKDAGANCIQTFVLSCNGYAWYKGGPIPEQPGLKHDFLPEVVRLGHEQRMLVMGYYCIAANSLWGQRHPEQSYGTPSSMHIPLTKDYIDYLCASVEDALKKTGIDGFMLDWMQNTSGKWLECEKTMYAELTGAPFPGADKITPADKAKFDELAVQRCWTRIRDTARKVKPNCILWPNGLHHLKLEGVDWLLNEGPDVKTTETARQQLDGRPIRLIQNQVGWSKHDARNVFSNPRYRNWDFYGFAAPYDNSLPLPVAEYLNHPMDDFKGTDSMTINDRNIAALIRFYLGKPVAPPPPWPEDLRCEYLENPLGIDAPRPRLSWKLRTGDPEAEKGIRQTAYQVLVASTPELLEKDQGDLWDSGRVASDRSIQVEYDGRPLESRMSCHWKVRVWPARRSLGEGGDQAGQASAWSAAARFVTGKMKPEDWQGQWIGAGADTNHAAVYLQKKMAVEKPVVRALVYFCGLGSSELAIDGRKVGDYVIGPGFTTYHKRAQYLAFDVTDRFTTPGAHQLDVTLVDGWYGLSKDPWVHKFEQNAYVDKPKLLFNLHLQHSDGTEAVIASDANWKWSPGEITRSWIVQEDIDLRQQARDWKPVAVVKGPGGTLVCQKEPPNRIVNEAKPVSFHYDAAGKSATWDFGREINGWLRFQASGPAGTKMTITTQAVGVEGGGLPGFPPRSSTFILGAARGPQTYEPRFFHSGMRHVTVTGLAEAPKQGDLTGCEISSLYAPAGDFTCSDESLTWLHDCVRRTMVTYTTFLPNDPVREWKAWTQDIQSMFWSAVYLFDSRAMYQRWEYDLLDTQDAAGNFPNVTPGPEFDPYNSPWWGGCAVWLPWEWYQYYGDDTLLREAYPAMKRYVDYLDTVAKDGLQQWGLLDWLPVEETPAALINTPAHVLFADIVSRTAMMLGKTEEAQQYAAIAARLRQTLNQKFLDPATGIYGQPGWKVVRGNWNLPKPLEELHSRWWTGDRPCTQAGQVLALAMDIPPREVRGHVEQALLKEIEAHHGRLSTGFVSTPYLLRILRDLSPETGWKMTTAREFPSWLSMTRGSGSDVMKETWAGGAALMPSLGGNIAAWNMESLAGIRPDPAAPGFKRIVIKPAVVGDVTWVKCHHDSPYGRIVSNWKREGGTLTMEVTIPANTTATVHVPARDAEGVTESGKPASQSEGVQFLRMEHNAAVYAVGSGAYRFQSPLPATTK